MTVRSRKGGGHLTPEEEDIWTHVTSSVHPLRRAAPERVPDVPMPPDLTGAPRASLVDAVVPPAGAPGQRHKQRWQPLVTTPTPRPKQHDPAPPSFDRRHAKKIATGRIEIEGRLDLHGLREAEAHVRLRGFLRQAQAQGKRTVLVITGKGAEQADPYAPFDFGQERTPRGVLKRNVPRWLAEPDLAPLVVSYTTANQRHGGEGALYVHLRKSG